MHMWKMPLHKYMFKCTYRTPSILVSSNYFTHTNTHCVHSIAQHLFCLRMFLVYCFDIHPERVYEHEKLFRNVSQRSSQTCYVLHFVLWCMTHYSTDAGCCWRSLYAFDVKCHFLLGECEWQWVDYRAHNNSCVHSWMAPNHIELTEMIQLQRLQFGSLAFSLSLSLLSVLRGAHSQHMRHMTHRRVVRCYLNSKDRIAWMIVHNALKALVDMTTVIARSPHS